MFERFFPCAYADSVFSIDFKRLFDKGYRGIIFDIDNTLVHHGDDATPEVEELFFKLHKIGFKTVILSNNNALRIERFLKNIGGEYVSDADKPDTKGYYKALEILSTAKENTVFIGDQIFTDICGANKCSMDSILVRFIQVDKNEKIGIRRHLERFILRFYRFSKKYNTLKDVVK